MMTMSECDLLPGEEDEWSSPYRVQQLQVECEVRISVQDEVVAVKRAPDDATAVVKFGDQGWTIDISR